MFSIAFCVLIRNLRPNHGSCCLQMRRMCKVKKGKEKYEDALKSMFTETDRENLLKYFNESTAEELASNRKLGVVKANNIVKFREENGKFSALDTILGTKGVGPAGLTAACKQFITGGEVQTKEKTPKITMIHPQISKETSHEMKDLVTLDIQHDSIFWSKINRRLEVEDWQQTILFETPIVKFDHAVLNDKINDALEQIPDCSIYVMEQKTFRYPHLKLVPFLTNLQILQWIVITTLNLKRGKNVVYKINPRAIDKMFDLDVGGERVTGKNIILDISKKKLIGNKELFNNVEIPNILMMNYLDAENGEKEKLATTLLTGLTFYRLALYSKLQL